MRSSTNRLDALAAACTVPPGHFDELLDADGAPAAVLGGIRGGARGDLERRPSRPGPDARRPPDSTRTASPTTSTRRPDGPGRPWTLDVAAASHSDGRVGRRSARGLRQRARLLNAVAADLYGAAEAAARAACCRRRWSSDIPVFSASATACRPPAACSCTWSRSIWRAMRPTAAGVVVGTRTQAPSGVGYALENRAIMSRVFPDAFRALRVQPLSPFFQALRDTLLAGAPVRRASRRTSCC